MLRGILISEDIVIPFAISYAVSKVFLRDNTVTERLEATPGI